MNNNQSKAIEFLKEFFRFTKGKAVVFSGLIFLAFIVMSGRGIAFGSLVLGIFWPFADIPSSIEKYFSFWTLMFIELVYLYVITCLMVFIYNKIKKK